MPIFERSFNSLLGDSLNELAESTVLNRVSPGSKARALLAAANRNLNRGYKDLDLNFARAYLSSADGRFLDLIGEILGTPRLGIEVATTSASAEIVRFYVDGGGTFGSINSSNPITIPANTILSTQDDNTGILFKTVAGVVIPAIATEQFISVVALSPGENSNIGANALVFHQFSNYTDSANKTLKVTNTSAILNGTNIESDTNYKFRISKSALSSEAANQTAILLAALTTPGVSNVIIQNRAEGIGTYKVLLKSVTPTVSDELVANVGAALSRVSAEGIRGIVARPLETGMAFFITLTYKNGVSNAERTEIETQIQDNITSYVNNLDIGEEFIYNELVELALSTSSAIKDIGIPNKPIDSVVIYKESRLGDNKVREDLFTNYTPRTNERLIIEPSLSSPITISRAN